MVKVMVPNMTQEVILINFSNLVKAAKFCSANEFNSTVNYSFFLYAKTNSIQILFCI